ncbi:DUF6461 domain-containing protein [Angustibacter aerolatus]
MRRVPLLLGAALLVALTGCSQTPPRAAVDERPTIYCVGTEDPSGGCVPPPAPADGVAGDADDADDADDASDEDEAPAEERPAPKGPAVQRTFAWADVDDWTPCLAFVRGLSPRAALQQLVDEPQTPLEAPAAVRRYVDQEPLDPEDGDRGGAYAGRLGGWTWTYEDDGYACSDPDRAVRMAAHGTFVSVYWDVELDNAFVLARDGKLLREIDVLDRADGTGPELPQERGLDWEDGLSAALAVQHRITGTPAHQPDWYERHATVAVGWLG